MRILTCLCVMVFVVTPVMAQSRPSPWLTGGLITANARDMIATELVLSDFACRPCHEANPLMRPFAGSTWGLLAAKSAGTALQVWTMHYLYATGHSRAAKIFAWIDISVPLTAGVLNLRR